MLNYIAKMEILSLQKTIKFKLITNQNYLRMIHNYLTKQIFTSVTSDRLFSFDKAKL